MRIWMCIRFRFSKSVLCFWSWDKLSLEHFVWAFSAKDFWGLFNANSEGERTVNSHYSTSFKNFPTNNLSEFWKRRLWFETENHHFDIEYYSKVQKFKFRYERTISNIWRAQITVIQVNGKIELHDTQQNHHWNTMFCICHPAIILLSVIIFELNLDKEGLTPYQKPGVATVYLREAFEN